MLAIRKATVMDCHISVRQVASDELERKENNIYTEGSGFGFYFGANAVDKGRFLP